MARILIKTNPSYEQTELAVKDYFKQKKIEADFTSDQMAFINRASLYDKYYSLHSHCVNTTIFSKVNKKKILSSHAFNWGNFSIDNMIRLKDFPNLHVFGPQKWPTHQFIAKCDYREIADLTEIYGGFYLFDSDPDWLYMSLVYSGCKPIIERNIKIITVDELVKEMEIE